MKQWLMIALALMLVACGGETPIKASGKKVTVGVLAPLSGKYRRMGEQGVSGLKVALKAAPLLNNGDKIELKIIDTKSQLGEAKTALDALAKENVPLIISLLSSNEMIAMKAQFDQHRIPVIATMATDDSIADEGGYITQVCMDNKTQALVAAHFIRDERLYERAGVIYDGKNLYSKNLAERFKQHFRKLGGNIEFFTNISSKKELRQLKRHNHRPIEVLFTTVNAMETSKFIQERKKNELNFDIVGTDGLLSDALTLKPEELEGFEGVFVIEHFALDKKESAQEKRLNKALEAEGYPSSSYAFLGYDTFALARYGMENCHEYNTQCMKAILQNSEVIDGAVSHFSMLDAKAKREVYVGVIKDAQLMKEVVVY